MACNRVPAYRRSAPRMAGQRPRPVAKNATRAGHPQDLVRAKGGGRSRGAERDLGFDIVNINEPLDNLLAWLARKLAFPKSYQSRGALPLSRFPRHGGGVDFRCQGVRPTRGTACVWSRATRSYCALAERSCKKVPHASSCGRFSIATPELYSNKFYFNCTSTSSVV